MPKYVASTTLEERPGTPRRYRRRGAKVARSRTRAPPRLPGTGVLTDCWRTAWSTSPPLTFPVVAGGGTAADGLDAPLRPGRQRALGSASSCTPARPGMISGHVLVDGSTRTTRTTAPVARSSCSTGPSAPSSRFSALLPRPPPPEGDRGRVASHGYTADIDRPLSHDCTADDAVAVAEASASRRPTSSATAWAALSPWGGYAPPHLVRRVVDVGARLTARGPTRAWGARPRPRPEGSPVGPMPGSPST
jgi:hypothetical protein